MDSLPSNKKIKVFHLVSPNVRKPFAILDLKLHSTATCLMYKCKAIRDKKIKECREFNLFYDNNHTCIALPSPPSHSQLLSEVKFRKNTWK